MPSKLIITGAIGLLAVATLAVNAQNASSKTITSEGSVLAASAHLVKVDRDEVAIAIRATAAVVAQSLKPAADDPEKTEVPARPAAPKFAIPTGCQAALVTLKGLRAADIAEDAGERSGTTGTATALAAERSEDLMEAQKWNSALMAARAACLPQPATACQTAIAGLQPILLTLRNGELSEQQTRGEIESSSDLAALRTAFSAVALACART